VLRYDDEPCIRLRRADHWHSARHLSRMCRHTAGAASHGWFTHRSRQAMARPPPWAAIAGNEDCIATRRASAASAYLVMKQLPCGSDQAIDSPIGVPGSGAPDVRQAVEPSTHSRAPLTRCAQDW